MDPPPSSAERVVPSPAERSATDVVAHWKGGTVTHAELDERTARDVSNLELRYKIARYEAELQALERLAVEAILEDEADRAGHRDVDALLVVEVEEKVAPPTDEEIDGFYPYMARQLRVDSLEEARPLVEAELLRRAQGKRYVAYIEELRAGAELSIDLPYPDLPRRVIPVGPNDPTVGAADAPVTVIQFAEYQCGFCQAVTPTVRKLQADYDGKVRFVFKDFPLSGHGRAIPAAIAARCAGEQGSYWEMNKILLENQRHLSDADIAGYAEGLGFEMEAFQACTRSGKYETAIYEDLEQGRLAGVEATPTFFVNGVLVAGAQPYNLFAGLIDRELAAHSGL